jgi:tellurite resistance protein TehA-like permease
MNQIQHSFRDRLLAVEKSTPTARYRKELANLRERRLSPFQRVVMSAVLVLVTVATVVMGKLAIAGPANMPMVAQLAFGTGAIGGLLCAAFIGGILRRGVVRRMKDPVSMNSGIWVMSGLSVAFALYLGGNMTDHGPSPFIGIYLILFMLFFFGSASVLLVRSHLEQIDLRTREKLLELEYQLAEISEQLKEP